MADEKEKSILCSEHNRVVDGIKRLERENNEFKTELRELRNKFYDMTLGQIEDRQTLNAAINTLGELKASHKDFLARIESQLINKDSFGNLVEKFNDTRASIEKLEIKVGQDTEKIFKQLEEKITELAQREPPKDSFQEFVLKGGTELLKYMLYGGGLIGIVILALRAGGYI